MFRPVDTYFPKCWSKAAKLAKDQKEEHPKVFDKALKILAEKNLVLGNGIPDKCKSLPWSFSQVSHHPRKEYIERLLRHSMRVQSGTVPGTEVSDGNVVMSNACFAAAGLMRNYLETVGIEDVEVVAGIIGQQGIPHVPHVWLEIGGNGPVEVRYCTNPTGQNLAKKPDHFLNFF